MCMPLQLPATQTDATHGGVNEQLPARLYLFIQMRGTAVLTLPQPLGGTCHRIPQKGEAAHPSKSTSAITRSQRPLRGGSRQHLRSCLSGPGRRVLSTHWPAWLVEGSGKRVHSRPPLCLWSGIHGALPSAAASRGQVQLIGAPRQSFQRRRPQGSFPS